MGQLRQRKLSGRGVVKVCHEAASPPDKPAKSSRSRGENVLKRASCFDSGLAKARPDLAEKDGAVPVEVTDAKAEPKNRTMLPECSFCRRTIHPDRAERLEGEYECACGTMFFVESDGLWREVMRNRGL